MYFHNTGTIGGTYTGNRVTEKVNHCLRTRACALSRFGHVPLCVTPWTVAHPAPLSMGFSRQEYWSGLPFPSQGIFPSQGSNPSLLGLLHQQAGSSALVPQTLFLKNTGKISLSNTVHREGNGSPLQYSCLENPMGGGAWQAPVHGVAKSQT